MFNFPFFHKKKYSEFSVQTSLGRIKLFLITKRISDKAYAKANVGDGIIKNAVFLQAIEDAVVDLPKRKWDDLSLKEWKEIRTVIRTMLHKDGILQFDEAPSDKEPDIFSKEEVEWFKKTTPIR